MHHSPELYGSAGGEPDREVMLRELLDLLSEMGPRQAATQLMQMIRPSPELYRTLLNNLTGAIDLLLRRMDLDGATQFLEMEETIAETIATPWALAEWHYGKGRLEMAQGQPEAAIPHFEKAADGIGDPDKQQVALHSMALALLETGHLVRAEKQFQQTVEIAREHSSALGMAQGYLGLAMVAQKKNKVPEAMSWLEQAHTYAVMADAADVITQILTEQSVLNAQSKNSQLASEQHQLLEEYVKLPAGIPEDIRMRALSALTSNRAALAMREGRREEALRLAEEAMADQSTLYKDEQIENLVVAGVINTVTAGNLKAGKQQLLAAFRLAEEIHSPDGLLKAGIGLTMAYALQSFFEPAYRVCAAAIDALERLRSQGGIETDRLRYIQDKTEIYDSIVLLSLILADLQRNSHYQRQALAYVERAKSRTFVELLGQTTNATPPSNLPPRLLESETHISTQLRTLETRLRTSMAVTEQEQVQRAYNEAQIELDEIWKQIVDIAPEYAALRRGQPITFEAIRTLLSNALTH